MQNNENDGSRHGALAGYILDQFLIDAFNPKTGSEKEIIVLTFIVTRKSAALRLCVFIKQGDFGLMDVEASPDPGEDGDVLVFVEMQRDREVFRNICELLAHIEYLVNKRTWQFKPYPHNQFLEFNRENFFNTVQQYSEEKMDRKPEIRESVKPEPEKSKEPAPMKGPDDAFEETGNLFRPTTIAKPKKKKMFGKSTLDEYLIPGKNLKFQKEVKTPPSKPKENHIKEALTPKKDPVEPPEQTSKSRPEPGPEIKINKKTGPRSVNIKDIPKKEYTLIKPLLGEFKDLKETNKRLNSHIQYLETVKSYLNHQIEIEQEREKNLLIREHQNTQRIKDLEERLNPIP